MTDVKTLYETNFILGRSCNGYIISEEESIDINELIDIYYAEAILKKI